MEKDLSKLRPFSPEEAKAGGLMCNISQVGEVYTYIAGPDAVGCIATENEKGTFTFSAVTNLFMLPLCWVGGKPVYAGDTLRQTTIAGEVFERIARKLSENGKHLEFDEPGSWSVDGTVYELTWPKPKINRKGWVNIYRPTTGLFAASASNVHETEKQANESARHGRLACVPIEWEEEQSE